MGTAISGVDPSSGVGFDAAGDIISNAVGSGLDVGAVAESGNGSLDAFDIGGAVGDFIGGLLDGLSS